jgi:hypothetical protein
MNVVGLFWNGRWDRKDEGGFGIKSSEQESEIFLMWFLFCLWVLTFCFGWKVKGL